MIKAQVDEKTCERLNPISQVEKSNTSSIFIFISCLSFSAVQRTHAHTYRQPLRIATERKRKIEHMIERARETLAVLAGNSILKTFPGDLAKRLAHILH